MNETSVSHILLHLMAGLGVGLWTGLRDWPVGTGAMLGLFAGGLVDAWCHAPVGITGLLLMTAAVGVQAQQWRQGG